MSAAPGLHAFAGYGVELEYMIVDRQTLAVLPIADQLLNGAAEVGRGSFGWSNELTLHLIELKNAAPDSSLEALPAAFQAEVAEIGRRLEPLGARLMPGGAHPWMDPRRETRLWPHDGADIYRAYDRVFGCRSHGWANLQSMQLNLPFCGDEEFARLHSAVRLLLPIIPALAASSPIAEGRPSGFLDFRMESYRTHQAKISSTIGRVIPDSAASRAEYQARVLEPIYRDIASCDPEGTLRHEWLNVRGVIPRFERSALEIRVIDIQECPQADLAIAAAVSAAARALYREEWALLAEQQAIATDALVDIFHACIRDAELAAIGNAGYLRLLGFPGEHCRAGDLWRHLAAATGVGESASWRETLGVMLERGPLARRILRAAGPECTPERLRAVYRELCDCLEAGRMFAGE